MTFALVGHLNPDDRALTPTYRCPIRRRREDLCLDGRRVEAFVDDPIPRSCCEARRTEMIVSSLIPSPPTEEDRDTASRTSP